MSDNEILLDWLHRAADGDGDAFSRIVTELEKPVYRLAFAIVGNREDAEDVSQETFLKLFRTLGTFRGDASVSTYVLTIAKNTALDELRRRKNRPADSMTLETEDGEDRQAEIADPDPYSDPAKSYAQKERIAGVRQAIADLPGDHRVILTLRDMEGRSYEEIADILGLTDGTVKSRLFRARQALKALLTERNIR